MLAIAIPVTLQNLLFSSFTLVDTLMIGRLGDLPLAAVGMAGKWTWFYGIVLFGFTSGAAVFIAQYFGANDRAGIHRTYGVMTIGTLAASLVFMLLAMIVPQKIIGLLSSDPAAIETASTYLRIIALAYPFQALRRSAGTLLQSTQRVVIPFVGAVCSVVTNIVLNAVLMPGESVRTGLVVLLPYRGRSDDDAMNLWREWFINCSMPRANAAGAAIEPFSTACFANDTGLPNSDGSISERYFTWKPSLDKVVEEGVAPDFRWFDAGWYCDPAGNTVETDWWGTVGTWSIDEEKWPGETFRESVEGFHKHGVKTLMWFEPERVTNIDDLVKNWGYKPEWAIAAGRSITNNIGDPECLKWTANRVISMLERSNVDPYREDNNANHNLTWKKLDGEESEKYGLPRWGVAENNAIVGHYKLWDTILEYCAATGKCTFVDSCASGGGRNDIESLRRGVPFMRSDADRTTSALRLSMSASFNRWIPFHGSCTKETATELESSAGAGSDAYVYRASYLPIFNYLEAFVHNPLLDYDNMRKFIGEWRSVNHLLVKDMYTLTPWHSEHDRCGWTALCYDDPDKGESLLLGFRMEDCEEDSCTVRLPFAQPEATYVLTDEDTGEKLTLSGEELLAGLTLRLDQPRSCVMYRMTRG